MRRLITIIFLLLSTYAYATEVYRSVDANGRPVFSNTPPAQTDKHEVIDVEVKNSLGAPNQPDPATRHIPIFNGPVQRPSGYRSSSRGRSKTDTNILRENCQDYRRIRFKTHSDRKRRDYWCGRLNRGK